jgi:hypothetical protein
VTTETVSALQDVVGTLFHRLCGITKQLVISYVRPTIEKKLNYGQIANFVLNGLEE